MYLKNRCVWWCAAGLLVAAMVGMGPTLPRGGGASTGSSVVARVEPATPRAVGVLRIGQPVVVEVGSRVVALVVDEYGIEMDVMTFSSGEPERAPREFSMPFPGESMVLLDASTGRLHLEVLEPDGGGQEAAAPPGRCRMPTRCAVVEDGPCFRRNCWQQFPDGSSCFVRARDCPPCTGSFFWLQCRGADGGLICNFYVIDPPCDPDPPAMSTR